jgi:hypothetical protein
MTTTLAFLSQRLRVVVFLLLGSAAAAAAQDDPSAYRAVSYQAGAAFSFAKPDYGDTFIKGLSLYADADLHQRVGLEVNVNLDNLLTPTGIGEETYLVGPRVILLHQEFGGRRDFFSLYGKVLGGVGTFHFKEPYYLNSSQSYGVLGLGAGIDIHATSRINVRAVDVDWQRWPGYGNGLTPLVVSFGAAYRF